MKMTDIRALSEDELAAKVVDLQEELFKLKFKNGIRQLDNTAVVAQLRKDIARVKTVISERRLNA